MMILIKVYDNMKKIDNVIFEYAFKFYVNTYSKKIRSVTIQNIHLFMLSPITHACNMCQHKKGWVEQIWQNGKLGLGVCFLRLKTMSLVQAISLL